MNEFNRGETPEVNEIKKTVPEETVSDNFETTTNTNGPTFFL